MLSKIFFVIMIVLMFAAIVIVHEWGHFIMAKKNGVLVHEFAIGMGPKLWGVQKGETLYSIRLLPIGGFCSMEEEVGKSNNPRAMSSKKPWQKLLIIVAGAVMNFVFAWVVMSIIVGYNGRGTNQIESLQNQMPAQEAGLMVGDRIIAVNGERVRNLEDLYAHTSNEPATYKLTIERNNNEEFDVNITTKQSETGRALFGFTAKRNHFNIWYNVKNGFIAMCEAVKQIWGSLLQLVTGQVGMNQVAGIVGVVDVTAKQWDQGMALGGFKVAIINLLYIAGLLSANLGIVNLLPLPALDGGRAVFIFIEMICGKAVPAEKEGAVHFVGMVLLMLLTVVICYNDIVRIIQ